MFQKDRVVSHGPMITRTDIVCWWLAAAAAGCDTMHQSDEFMGCVEMRREGVGERRSD